MKIAVCYVAVTHGPKTYEFCNRFVRSYWAFPPGVDHDTVILCNGGPLPQGTAELFGGMRLIFYPRRNDGSHDLGAYRDVSSKLGDRYDAMLYLGESVYFHREGWLRRLAEAWQKHGPGMYGIWGSHVFNAHLQTTGFLCAPKFVAEWSEPLSSKMERYVFEHGTRALWRRLHNRKVPVMLVTWDGEWAPRQWRKPANILWRGDQSNCLMFCNHTDRYAASDEKRKKNWAASADREYR